MTYLLNWRLWAAIALAAGLAASYIAVYKAGKNAVQVEFDVYKMAAEMAHEAVIIKNGQDSAKLQKEKDDAITLAQRENAALQVALAGSNRAHDSLLKSTSAAAARARAACSNTPAGPGITPTDDIGMLANVLGRIDERAGELAAYAQSANNAGLSCEAQYESVRQTLNPN